MDVARQEDSRADRRRRHFVHWRDTGRCRQQRSSHAPIHSDVAPGADRETASSGRNASHADSARVRFASGTLMKRTSSRATLPYWEDAASFPMFKKIDQDIDTDVVIVG